MSTVIEYPDSHTMVVSETPTDPAMPLVIEVVGRPATWVPVIVISAPRIAQELPAVTTSDVPPHVADPATERAWEIVAALTARRDEMLANALPEVPHYVGPRLREPTYLERYLHTGRHRSAAPRAGVDVRTLAVRAYIVLGGLATVAILVRLLGII